MNYRSVSDLGASARQLAQSLPGDIDLVVGIPRSGLLAANLLCLHLDRPMTDVDGLCEERLLQTGHRYDGSVSSFEDIDRVLVLDDSVKSGTQMTETKARLAEENFSFELEYAAIYISKRGHNFVDHWAEVVDTPRVFEWNLMHHPMLKHSCIDIDGVLCRDPTADENDDGPKYREFITTVEPQIVPTERVGWLVTNRLEKYRPETEQWLAEHGIEYEELVMCQASSMEERQRRADHARFKARIYDETDAELFIESDPHQANEITKYARKPVFCYEANEMFRPGMVAEAYTKSNDYLSRLATEPVTFVTRASMYVASWSYNTVTMAAHKYRNR
ncbi:phosphoribosyltransferase family protein [Halomarina salina]|uniref:Phosphoribosyltransferase family protein n=1 Tax=Halomarina salina TaxID=1872699 RepID=A0ABD5RHU6_9EURY|nr:phosphoribosyltransferase family protein [Halomarina salina]